MSRSVGAEQTLDFEAPARLFKATPSKLAAYTDCPRRYRERYVEGRRGVAQPWAHMSLGNSVHLALARWWDQPVGERTPGTAVRLLHTHWVGDGFRDDAQEEATKDIAASWVEGYTATLDPEAEPYAVEREVAARSSTLLFTGRVDRLDARDGTLAIVDYKTGARGLVENEARGSSALALYAAAAQRMLRRACARVELHHIPTGEVQAHDHDETALRRAISRAEDVAVEAMAAEDAYAAGVPADEAFPPSPGAQCGSCAFRDECAPGRAAVPEVPKTWAHLPLEVR
ncbi:MAG TPA: PD-(D/E)XK nuclease family protein [Mycobacteriales bacterium]|nr:PD-(D/E)XK nuclease family protein [Mycobacteriales bacterium]